MKSGVWIAILVVVVLVCSGGLVYLGLNGSLGEGDSAEDKLNKINEDYFLCFKGCPEDNDGNVEGECMRDCVSVAEDGVLRFITFELEDYDENEDDMLIFNMISQKNRDAAECTDDCGSTDIQDYDCVQNCLSDF